MKRVIFNIDKEIDMLSMLKVIKLIIMLNIDKNMDMLSMLVTE